MLHYTPIKNVCYFLCFTYIHHFDHLYLPLLVENECDPRSQCVYHISGTNCFHFIIFAIIYFQSFPGGGINFTCGGVMRAQTLHASCGGKPWKDTLIISTVQCTSAGIPMLLGYFCPTLQEIGIYTT